MAVHFDEAEFAARMDRLQAAMAERRLDAMLLFAQESMYWLTGYDTSGFSFFQCLVVTKERRLALVARAADLRQARQTTMVDEIIVWSDRPGADSAKALKDHLFEMDLLGCRIGIEYDTPGLNGRSARQLDEQIARLRHHRGRLRAHPAAAHRQERGRDRLRPPCRRAGGRGVARGPRHHPAGRRRRNADRGDAGGRAVGRRGLPGQRVRGRLGPRGALDPTALGAPCGRAERPGHAQLRRRLAPLPRRHDGDRRRRRAASPACGDVRGMRRCRRQRGGDDAAGQHVRRGVRRHRARALGPWYGCAQARLVRLLARRRIRPDVDRLADDQPREPGGDRAEHGSVPARHAVRSRECHRDVARGGPS